MDEVKEEPKRGLYNDIRICPRCKTVIDLINLPMENNIPVVKDVQISHFNMTTHRMTFIWQ